MSGYPVDPKPSQKPNGKSPYPPKYASGGLAGRDGYADGGSDDDSTDNQDITSPDNTGGGSAPNQYITDPSDTGGGSATTPASKTPGLVPGCKISPKVLNVAAAEAGGKEDLPWILATINNRAKAWGMTPDDIVTQRKQFEAYGNGSWKNVSPKRLSYLMSDPAVQAACNGVFPEGSEGVMNFYAPTAQKLLYGNLPKWDNGTGKDIGQSRFFKDPNYKDPPKNPGVAANLPMPTQSQPALSAASQSPDAQAASPAAADQSQAQTQDTSKKPSLIKSLEDPQNFIPLLSALAAMGTAPTRSLGVALAAGAGAQSYQGQRQFGLETQKVENEKNRVAATLDTARLAGVKAALDTINNGTIDLASKPGIPYPEGRNLLYNGRYYSPQELKQKENKLTIQNLTRGMANGAMTPINVLPSGGIDAQQWDAQNAHSAPPTPAAPAPSSHAPAPNNPHSPVATPAAAPVPDPVMAKYKIEEPPSFYGRDQNGHPYVDESKLPPGVKSYTAIQQAISREQDSNDPHKEENIAALHAQGEATRLSPAYSDVYGAYNNALDTWQKKNDASKKIATEEQAKLSDLRSGMARNEEAIRQQIAARHDFEPNLASQSMATAAGWARSVPGANNFLPHEVGDYQNHVSTIDNTSTTLLAAQTNLNNLTGAPATAMHMEAPAKLDSSMPNTPAYQALAEAEARNLQLKDWTDEFEPRSGQPIDWGRYKNDWFAQHPMEKYVKKAAALLPFLQGMSNEDKFKYIDAARDAKGNPIMYKRDDNGDPTLYNPATDEQTAALPVGSLFRDKNGNIRKVPGKKKGG
jgi:hypothetical protein